jgi:adenylate cyclase
LTPASLGLNNGLLVLEKDGHLRTSALESFRLIYRLKGRHHQAEFDRPSITLGRSTNCDLVLPLTSVSRRHAMIECVADGWQIVDQDSRFGTFVNGQRITRRKLEDGDRIALGEGTPEISFALPPERSHQESGVRFRDAEPEESIRMTIAVEKFERLLSNPLAPAAEPAGSGQLAVAAPKLPLVGLFQRIGELLLASESLDAMLGGVLDLAMATLPAERGLICLCDENLEQFAPKAVRIKGPAQGAGIDISRSIAREAVRRRQALLVSNAAEDVRFAEARSVRAMHIRDALCAPLYHDGRVDGLIYLDTRSPEAEDRFGASELELLTAMGVLTAVGMFQARLRDDVNRERAIRARLSRYSSPRVIEHIVAALDTPDGAMLAQQHEVSVLFADLCGFTSLAEGRDPAAVVQMLNRLFERLTQVVFQQEGTLDKYLGDGLLAIFGAPLPQPDHARRAVRAALGLQQALEESSFVGPQGEPLQMRIGINSGPVIAGDIGSPIRKDYTVIGDVVNVASRLQSSVARPGQIVLGPATYELCREEFRCQPLPEALLKGKQQVVRPYLVIP